MTAVRVERSESRTTLTLDGASRLNALSVDTLRELQAQMREAERDPATKVVVLTGAGRAFCAGADLAGEVDIATVMDVAADMIRTIADLEVPIVAAVNGPAVGFGASLLAACDLAIAAESAYIELTFTRIGLMPDGGLTHTLVAAVGRAVAGDLVLSGRRISAREALGAGLVSRVAADADFAATVDEIARSVSERPRAALTASKLALNGEWRSSLESALARESAAQIGLLESPDFARLTARFRTAERSRS